MDIWILLGGSFWKGGPRTRRAQHGASLREPICTVSMMRGEPNRLATPAEALRVQKLVEAMLAGR